MIKDYNVRIPPLSAVSTAIELFYSQTELGNAEIELLFNKPSTATISRLKNKARKKMIELDIPSWNANRVNTKAAYEAWGLDIKDLETLYRKMQELNISGAKV